MMDVLTAFREFAPPTADPRSVAHTTECARVLYQDLRDRTRKLPDLEKAQIAEDAIEHVMAKLYRGGPRGVRAGDDGPSNPVGGYLYRCLRNFLFDYKRKNKDVLRWDDVSLDDFADDKDALDHLEAREAEYVRQAVERQLFDDIVPAVAASGPSGAAFLTSVHRLRQAVQREWSVEQVAESIIVADPEPMGRDVVQAAVNRGLPLDTCSAKALAQRGMIWHASAYEALVPCQDGGACCREFETLYAALVAIQVPRLRVNLDARFRRARERLLSGIDKMRVTHQLSAERAELLRQAVHAHLRFYQSGGSK